MAALNVIDFFLELLGHPFVLGRQLSVNILELDFIGAGLKPLTQTRTAVPRSGGMEDRGNQGFLAGKIEWLGGIGHVQIFKNSWAADLTSSTALAGKQATAFEKIQLGIFAPKSSKSVTVFVGVVLESESSSTINTIYTKQLLRG